MWFNLHGFNSANHMHGSICKWSRTHPIQSEWIPIDTFCPRRKSWRWGCGGKDPPRGSSSNLLPESTWTGSPQPCSRSIQKTANQKSRSNQYLIICILSFLLYNKIFQQQKNKERCFWLFSTFHFCHWFGYAAVESTVQRRQANFKESDVKHDNINTAVIHR